MKKKIILIGFCLLLTSAFAGCAPEMEDTAPQIIENQQGTDGTDRKSKPGSKVGGESNGNDQDPKGGNEKPGNSLGG